MIVMNYMAKKVDKTFVLTIWSGGLYIIGYIIVGFVFCDAHICCARARHVIVAGLSGM